MRVLIYESSSRGGNYKYAISLFNAYQKHAGIVNVELIIPSNSIFKKENGIRSILLSDHVYKNKWQNKFSFFLRNLLNPFILFFYMAGKPKTLVLFNDFEQLSAPLWTPFFRIFLSKHRYSIFLHDPDRDQYLSNPRYASFSMRVLMKMMNLALYHDQLPEKHYYKNSLTKYLSVPHGVYTLPSSDKSLLQQILKFKGSGFLFSILGNIRKEKNYKLAIRALKELSQAKLIVAGSPANTSIDLQHFKREAEELGVKEKIFWHIKYLDEAELAAVITASDCILMNYAATFASQSGIINMIAPFKKRIIVSETQSSLTKTVKQFNLGTIIKADNEQALISGMEQTMINCDIDGSGWKEFIQYASWEIQVNLVVEAYEEL